MGGPESQLQGLYFRRWITSLSGSCSNPLHQKTRRPPLRSTPNAHAHPPNLLRVESEPAFLQPFPSSHLFPFTAAYIQVTKKGSSYSTNSPSPSTFSPSVLQSFNLLHLHRACVVVVVSRQFLTCCLFRARPTHYHY
jgi:hypothetical protein